LSSRTQNVPSRTRRACRTNDRNGN
jgi:hypothetical protein